MFIILPSVESREFLCFLKIIICPSLVHGYINICTHKDAFRLSSVKYTIHFSEMSSCLSVCMFVYLPVSLSVCLYLPIRKKIRLKIWNNIIISHIKVNSGFVIFIQTYVYLCLFIDSIIKIQLTESILLKKYVKK